jgi:oligopeptide/dipeptide ABC transporter ATP-binding protein
MSRSPLLSVRDLKVELPLRGRWFPAVNGVSFDLERGESLALAGESGCGKTLLGRALINLAPETARLSGSVFWEGHDLRTRPEEEWARIRGGRIAMVFQEPGAALDPVRTIGDQIVEAIRLHRDVPARQARQLAVERLREVSFPDPASGAEEYPHRLSGGQKQRAMLAVALAADPDLLIADEPTTALDATVAAEVMELLARLRERRGLTLLLISHDLPLVARASGRALILYAGRIVEEAATSRIFQAPRHPYTRGLLRCLPGLDPQAGQRRRFDAIGGAVPDLLERPDTGCAFAPRCPERFGRCVQSEPELYEVDGVSARCFLYEGSGRGEGEGGEGTGSRGDGETG